jgi:lysophospholipase L1-like esterase
VLHDQAPLVVERVEIISAIAGANDLMARRVDPTIVLRQMDELLDWALDHADLVLTCTCPDFLVGRSAQLPRLAARIDTINEHVEQRRTSAAGRLVVVDAHAVLAEPAFWATDGIHANPRGHARLAEVAIPLLEEAPTSTNTISTAPSAAPDGTSTGPCTRYGRRP